MTIIGRVKRVRRSHFATACFFSLLISSIPTLAPNTSADHLLRQCRQQQAIKQTNVEWRREVAALQV
eukprot:1907432-Rhodomonas_salina.1